MYNWMFYKLHLWEVIKIKRNYKKDISKKFLEATNNHLILILVILFVLVLLFPVLICVFYKYLLCKPSISADGMIGYLGATISSFIALFIAFIGIYKNNENEELQEDLQINLRRKQIRPILHPCLYSENDDLYLIVENLSSNAAFSPVLFGKDIANFITSNNPIKIKIVFTNDLQDPDVYVFDESFYELNEDGYPRELIFVYSDVDNNIITERFKYISTDLGFQYRSIQDIEYE